MRRQVILPGNLGASLEVLQKMRSGLAVTVYRQQMVQRFRLILVRIEREARLLTRLRHKLLLTLRHRVEWVRIGDDAREGPFDWLEVSLSLQILALFVDQHLLRILLLHACRSYASIQKLLGPVRTQERVELYGLLHLQLVQLPQSHYLRVVRKINGAL